MKTLLVLFFTLSIAPSVLAQGSDEGNSSNNGELEARLRGPKAAISREQKAKIESASLILSKAKVGLEGLQSNVSLINVVDHGPSNGGSVRQAREDWLSSMKAVVSQVIGIQSAFKRIRPGEDSEYELDYRLARSAAGRLNELVRSCATFADLTLSYMNVLPDTLANRDLVGQAVGFLELIVEQMSDVKRVLEEIGGTSNKLNRKGTLKGG